MNHDPEYQERLDQLIDLELKRLPRPQVPDTLLQRVLTAIDEDKRKPWWQKPWTAWPFLAQIFFLISLFALGGTLVYGLAAAPTDLPIEWVTTKFAGLIAILKTGAAVLGVLANAFALVLAALSKSWLLMGIVAAVILYASSVALGVAWFRVALHQRAFTFKLL